MDILAEILAGFFVAALLRDETVPTSDGKWLYRGEEPYASLIAESEAKYGIPARLLAAVLWKESRYRSDIISGSTRSSVGAVGIAQFLPSTAVEELGSVAAATQPHLAIPGAARYMKKIADYLGSGATWRDVVIAYNWGMGNAKQWIARGRPVHELPGETVDYAAETFDKLYG